MQLKTIFNHVTRYKPFVAQDARFVENESGVIIEVTMRARENGLPTCSGCGARCPGYDTTPEPRRFNFVPLWMIPVFLIYTMRRVDCPNCGVKVERLPWADGKSPLTTEYQWFLAGWARRRDEATQGGRARRKESTGHGASRERFCLGFNRWKFTRDHATSSDAASMQSLGLRTTPAIRIQDSPTTNRPNKTSKVTSAGCNILGCGVSIDDALA